MALLFLFRIEFDHGIDSHDGDTSLHRTLQLSHLTHARLKYAGLDRIMDSSLHQIQTVVLVGLLLSNCLFLIVCVSFLDTLGEGVADTQLGDELGRILGGVHGQGLRDDQERLGKFADCKLFSGSL